jgi:hypothetical protein
MLAFAPEDLKTLLEMGLVEMREENSSLDQRRRPRELELILCSPAFR